MKERYRAKTCSTGAGVAKFLNEQAEEGYEFLYMASSGDAENGQVIVIVEYRGEGEPPEATEKRGSVAASQLQPVPPAAGYGRRR